MLSGGGATIRSSKGGGAGGGREWRRERAGRAGADGFTGDMKNEESRLGEVQMSACARLFDKIC